MPGPTPDRAAIKGREQGAVRAGTCKTAEELWQEDEIPTLHGPQRYSYREEYPGSTTLRFLPVEPLL